MLSNTTGTAATAASKGPKKSSKVVKANGKDKAASGQTKRWTWKKPGDKPKRNLSAYNFFFQEQRQIILKERQGGAVAGTNGESVTSKVGPDGTIRLGFDTLARTVATRWRTLDPKLLDGYKELAKRDRERYQAELALWTQKRAAETKLEEQRLAGEVVGGPVVQQGGIFPEGEKSLVQATKVVLQQEHLASTTTSRDALFQQQPVQTFVVPVSPQATVWNNPRFGDQMSLFAGQGILAAAPTSNAASVADQLMTGRHTSSRSTMEMAHFGQDQHVGLSRTTTMLPMPSQFSHDMEPMVTSSISSPTRVLPVPSFFGDTGPMSTSDLVGKVESQGFSSPVASRRPEVQPAAPTAAAASLPAIDNDGVSRTTGDDDTVRAARNLNAAPKGRIASGFELLFAAAFGAKEK